MSQAELSLIRSEAGDDRGAHIDPDAAGVPALESDFVAVILGSLVGTFSVIAFTWLAVLGFAGGAVPVLGWSLPGGLLDGLRFLALLATGGVLVLWGLPVAISMVVYALLSRMLPGVRVRAPRPRRTASRQVHPVDRAA